MFSIAYTFKRQLYMFEGRVKIVSHSSCRTSALLKYFVPCPTFQAWSGSKLFYAQMVFLKDLYEKIDFQKNQQTTLHEKIPRELSNLGYKSYLDFQTSILPRACFCRKMLSLYSSAYTCRSSDLNIKDKLFTLIPPLFNMSWKCCLLNC